VGVAPLVPYVQVPFVEVRVVLVPTVLVLNVVKTFDASSGIEITCDNKILLVASTEGFILTGMRLISPLFTFANSSRAESEKRNPEKRPTVSFTFDF
jgi:hypothetical protein